MSPHQMRWLKPLRRRGMSAVLGAGVWLVHLSVSAAQSPSLKIPENPSLTVTGQILDGTTRKPVPGAQVTAFLNTGSPQGTITSPQGTYSMLVRGQLGMLIVTVSHPAYAARTITRAVDGATRFLSVDVTLTSSKPAPSPSPYPSPSPSPFAGRLLINGDAPFTNRLAVTLTLKPPQGSEPAAGMVFSNDGKRWSIPEPFAKTKTWQLTSGDGTKRVWARLYSKRGAILSVMNDAIQLDMTPPRITVTSPRDGVSLPLDRSPR